MFSKQRKVQTSFHESPVTNLHIDDLIPDERLQEHTHQPNQSVLHVLVLDILAARDAI